MADVNYLQKVEEGEKIKASVTNSNNNYLDNKIDTNTKNLTDVINGIKTSLQSQIDTNNTNLTNSMKSLKDSVNSSINNSVVVNGNSLKFSNGVLINWGSVGGMGNNTWNNVNWSTPFVGWYCVAGAATYQQWAGDKGSSWAVTNQQTTYVQLRSGFEQSGNHTIWLIAIGRWK